MTNEIAEIFLSFESSGYSSITLDEYRKTKPLFEAKENYELTLKEVIHDMISFWSQRFGWYVPLQDDIVRLLYPLNNKNRDNHYLKALIKIAKQAKFYAKKKSIIDFFESRPKQQLSDEELYNYIERYLRTTCSI